jgi:hypothetical protein
MNTPQPPSPRRRLQELLAIPDSQRTEAEWEELNEIEIKLAPGNRIDAPMPGNNNNKRNGPPQNVNPTANPGQKPKKPFKKFHKKPKPPNPNPV